MLSLSDVLELDAVFEGMAVPQGHLAGGTVEFLLHSLIDSPVDGGPLVGDVEFHSVVAASESTAH